MAKKQASAGQDAPAKKAATKKATQPAAKATKSAPAAAPKPAAKAAQPAAKKAAPVKLTDKQTELLTRVQSAGEGGYKADPKEKRSLEALREKKVIKPLRNKETKELTFLVTKSGEKHLGGTSA